MRNQLPCIKMLMGLAIVALAFTLGTATAQERDQSMLKVGTVVTMEGIQLLDNKWVPYEQYMKCSGKVIVQEV